MHIQRCGTTLPGLAQLDKAGITVAEVGTLGLNSGDLRDLGVEVSIMFAKNIISGNIE